MANVNLTFGSRSVEADLLMMSGATAQDEVVADTVVDVAVPEGVSKMRILSDAPVRLAYAAGLTSSGGVKVMGNSPEYFDVTGLDAVYLVESV
ncbi:hypothetical protein [Cohaesibacter celericrescens]|uniref:Uncharacterized protein n=1 Tax=Cohaesibacter celericrescens TaxID=2067669 RepID=A0A2N5XX30_9HYPH|nr:hypothetical protein [Cohaesibacter celericrescens]PLW79063.1 hypothetical protein C0081_02195 [Cohaesibacter celericrescens]